MNREQMERCRQHGDVTGNGVVFDWGVCSPDGAWFMLFQEAHHSQQDIAVAKKWLRNNQDVLSISVVKIKGDG